MTGKNRVMILAMMSSLVLGPASVAGGGECGGLDEDMRRLSSGF